MHQGSAKSARCIVDMGDCRRRVRGVVWIWVIVGVVGVRSRWVGGGDPLEI